MGGPLSGLKVLEFTGLGPAPFCCMLLSDLGADVVRVDRVGAAAMAGDQVVARGRRSVLLDLKDPEQVQIGLRLAGRADVLVEGFRPGVMERLGLGPQAVHALNPRLVYGRMTGWGQTGPLAATAGHDINYIALSGALNAIGGADKPVPPLNLVGDYGGGALYLAMGILAALRHVHETGQGQVVDCAITDGAASLMSFMYGFRSAGEWSDERYDNLLDGGRPYYDTYQCADGRWLAVGPLEPQFFAIFCGRLGLDGQEVARQTDATTWPAMRRTFESAFLRRTRDEWCAVFEGTDACVAPVLTMAEAPSHPHNLARATFVEHEGVVQPAPAPRFSLTPGSIQGPAPAAGADAAAVFADWLSSSPNGSNRSG